MSTMAAGPMGYRRLATKVVPQPSLNGRFLLRE
jgi:hypothetical protein